MRVLVTTVPFGEKNKLPLELLAENGIEVVINPLGRKLRSNELADLAVDFDALIAGTEVISAEVFQNAKELKLISRVGIGLDGLDLNEARNRDILVSYTPDAPAPAVAELTICQMLNLLRKVPRCDRMMHEGHWERHFGRRLSEITIGVIGVGRIGSRVIRRLVPFGSPRVLLNDTGKRIDPTDQIRVSWVDKQIIFEEADLITLHLPLTSLTKNLISERELKRMKSDSLLINTSRGGIVNEIALYNALKNGEIEGAAIDVFEEEPYKGPLRDLPNCILTAHMGSMSEDCRAKMEIEATEEIIRFQNGLPLKNPVPDFEYLNQR